MSVYLQFDSSARSNPFIQTTINNNLVWVPNDNYPNNAVPPYSVYQTNRNLVQSPTNYRVFYRELNDANNVRTIGFLAHCKERPTNLNFSVESCTAILPASALVPRVDEQGNTTYVSILDEPYIFVRVMPINHAEGNLIYSNNPAADDATFIMWCDKIQPGTSVPSPPITDPVPRPNIAFSVREALDSTRWVVYKSCMITVMRLDLQAEEWQIRLYDRFGNDIVLGESDNLQQGFPGDAPPAVDPDLQTMILMGIKPNYPL